MKNNIIFGVATLACCAALSQNTSSNESDLATQKLASWDIRLKSGQEKISGGYYAHIIKNNNKWEVKEISQIPPHITDYENEEAFAFDPNFQVIQPNYGDMNKSGKNKGVYLCSTGVLRTKADNARRDYNPCDSSLTSTSSYEILGNATLAVFSFGVTALLGTSFREVQVDPIKVVTLLEESHLMDISLPKFRRNIWLTEYRARFKIISTLGNIDSFIERYEKDDPDLLIPQAEAMRDSIKKKEDQLQLENLRAQEDRRRREAQTAELRAQEAELRNKNAAEEYRRDLAALKVPGTKVCKTYDGIYEEDTGFSSFGRAVNNKITGTYYVTGFTEGISESRVQIRTASIRHVRLSGQSVVIEKLTNSGEGFTLQPGVIFWDDQNKWRPCKY